MLANRKVVVMGHARHGKDTVAERLRDTFGLQYRGSSEICAEFVKQEMQDLQIKHYPTVEACFEDRGNFRADWHKIIHDYNRGDPARLGKLIFSQADIYCGIRDVDELNGIVAEFDPILVWVSADSRVPQEDSSSINISFNKDTMIPLLNDGTLDQLYRNIDDFVFEHILGKWRDRFLELAKTVSYWSKDIHQHVGAVVVDPGGRVMSPGFNGFPKGIDDSIERRQDKEFKNSITLHAEANAISNAKQSVDGWHLFVTKPPCLTCALTIIQEGIASITCPPIDMNSSWAESNIEAKNILNEANVRVLFRPHGL